VTRGLPEGSEARMKAIQGHLNENARLIEFVQLQLDIITFAFASDLVRVATLQVGDLADGAQYTIDGVVQPEYHMISHRILSDGENAPEIKGADLMHHQIDRIHARLYFKYLLDRLSQYSTPSGTLLDQTMAVWTNSLATGSHRYTNIPYVIAGSAGGYLETGRYLRAAAGSGFVTNNKILSTLLNAALRRPKDKLIDDFGEPALEKGVIPQMLT
jgi:hypothetical protein